MTTETLVPTSITRSITHTTSSPGAGAIARPRATPDIDATEALGEQIAALVMRLHAATYELLVLLRKFDQHTGWHGGFASCAHWLHWRTGINLGAAREKVRVAPRAGESSAHQRHYAAGGYLLRQGACAHSRGHAGERGGAADLRAIGHRRPCGAPGPRLAPRASARRWAGVASSARLPGFGAVRPLGLLAEAALSADLDRGSAGDRYQVMLHIDSASGAGVAAGEPSGVPARDGLSGTLEIDHGAVDVSAEATIY